MLDEYVERLKVKKLELLEQYLLEAIKILMHKKNFIEKVSVDKIEINLEILKLQKKVEYQINMTKKNLKNI